MIYRKRLWISFFVLIFTGILCWGCASQTKPLEKLKDLEFTVVEEEDIPQELLDKINEKKRDPFKLTFSSKGKDYRYIVVGYGTKNTGGYSISVEQLFLSENAIYVDTNLIGPKKDEVVTQALTYPYIVLKIEYIDKRIVFE